MKNKFFIVVIIVLFFILSAGSYFYFFGRKSSVVIGIPEKENFLIGDVVRYIEYQTCDDYSKAVVEKLGLDKNKIHSCSSSKNEDGFYVVELEFGEAQDCPAGCFYETIVYKVSMDKKIIEEFNEGIEEEK